MTTIAVKAVIIVDGDGNYLIHGSNNETPKEMFKTMSPLWQFDPSNEKVHYIEVEILLPS